MKTDDEKFLLKFTALAGFNLGWKRNVLGVLFEVYWFILHVYLWFCRGITQIWLRVKTYQLVHKKDDEVYDVNTRRFIKKRNK